MTSPSSPAFSSSSKPSSNNSSASLTYLQPSSDSCDFCLLQGQSKDQTSTISLVASTSFSQRFQIGILRFTDASKLSFFGTAIPLRFRAIPVAPDSDSDSEAGIGAQVPLP
ncbi:hypothetical protein ISN45_Aa06g014150 [Arabidopsis thaliana x Arabidopsis arenosa]|uniref:Uncharacterized protein n=1 Tax=Arabidopsis thaliana x Arabidopsis arenosa TaxID=1240361 RepID=A0A8T1YY31_9BRAS|nr:hypothetical protein ISN45_Aa06g014150 [Arabidopsis thaliana x Arabidopsis arenosa]